MPFAKVEVAVPVMFRLAAAKSEVVVAAVRVARKPVKFCKVEEPETRSVPLVVRPVTVVFPPTVSAPSTLLLPVVVAFVNVASVAVNCCSEEELVTVSAVAERVLPFQVKEFDPERFVPVVQKVT